MQLYFRGEALARLALVTLFAAASGVALARPVAGSVPDAWSISGRIADATGQPIAQATVRVVEIQRSGKTGEDGRFTIAQVAPGTYTLAVTAIGYEPQVRRVTLSNGAVTVDVSLKATFIELPAVQISASAEATSAMNSPQPVGVVSEEELAKARPATLGEALTGIAGVRNNSSGPAAGKPVIRGLTNTRVLVVDNGQRLEHNQWGDDHFSSVEPSDAGRIEVIRGPASVLYGSDALGGVINVIPPDLPDGIGRSGFVQGSLSAGFGSGNQQADGALTLEGASGGFGFRFSGNARRAENVRTPSYQLWNSGFHNEGGSGTLGYRAIWGSLTGNYAYGNTRLDLTDADPAATGRAGTDDHRGHAELSLALGPSRLDWDAGFERNQRHEWEDATATAESFFMRQYTYTTDIRLHHAFLGPLSGLVGASGEYTTDTNLGEEHLIPDAKAGGAGVYAFEQTDVGRWNLSFGARYDYRRLEVVADPDIGNTAQTHSWNSITGNLGLLYHVTEPVALVLNVGRGFRSPSAFDLFANGPHEATSTFERGNSGLRTESSINTDFRIRINATAAALEIGAFTNVIQNFIYTVPTGLSDSASGFAIYDVTQGNALLTGFEGQIQAHPTEFLHLEGTADYVCGKNTTTKDALPSMPPLRATYVARLEGRSLGSLSSPYFSVGGETNARQTRLNPAEVTFFADALGGAGYTPEGYTLLNLGAGFVVPTGAGRDVRFDLELRNALDQAWADYLSHLKALAPNPGMGRSLNLRMTAGF
jgi:iron complex outermembrane receptor protein